MNCCKTPGNARDCPLLQKVHNNSGVQPICYSIFTGEKGCSFFGGKINLGMKLTTRLYLAPNLKMNGDLPLLTRVPSCHTLAQRYINPLNTELNPICCLLALLAHHFLHVSRIRVKLLTLRLLMSYIYIYIWSTYS